MPRSVLSQEFLLLVLASTIWGCTGESSEKTTAPEFWSHRFVLLDGLAYGEDPSQIMDGYLQGSWVGPPSYFTPTAERRPTLIWIHGGGWLEKKYRGNEPFYLHFLEKGWNVFSITHRIGPGTAPDAVDDAVCALKYVADKAAEWPIDKNKIVVAGGSAGGHLALTAGILGSRPGHQCYPGDDFEVAAIVNWFGVTDISRLDSYLAQNIPERNIAAIWIGEKNSVSEISARYSPVNIADNQTPPVITIHGDADRLVPHDQAVMLHEKLQTLGVENELQTMPGGKHLGFTDSQFQRAFRSIFAFLDRIGVSSPPARSTPR